MGFLKDLFKGVVDEATGGAISMMEVNREVGQLQQLQQDSDTFDSWFAEHSHSYTDLLDSLNHSRYQVDARILHSNWLTGRVETAYSLTPDEISENNRRKRQIEQALEAQAPHYMEKLFKDYLSESEKTILDSYSAFRTFQTEMSYLPAFQKKIIDSIYLNEAKELLGASGLDTALTKISDLTWQIDRHKTPAGHAIVLLLLVKQAYCESTAYTGKIKIQVENVLSRVEDIVIDNTYRAYLPEDADGQSAEELLQAGKDFFLNGEPEKAFACFLFAAKGGSAEAQYRTGRSFEQGYGVYKNAEKAVSWYQESAKSSLPVSKYYLASIYRQVLPEDKRDYQKAIALYREAFDEGVADAADKIGSMYAEGTGVEKDDTAAAEWYEKGAAAGSPSAMYHLYTAYLDGNGVEADSETAKKWFDKCLSYFYAPPAPVQSADSPEQEEAGMEFYGDSLQPGCDDLFGPIALVFHNGSSVVSKNIDRKFKWFEKGAAIGDLFSLDWLSYLYTESAVPYKSVEFARRGAECGCTTCINKMGLRYYSGMGIDQDRVTANIWFLRAAKCGDQWGQRNVAYEFLSGTTGLPKDTAEARRWLSLAAAQGNEESQKKLDELDEQDREKRREELKKQREELEKKRSGLLSQIAGVDEKIQDAQSPREEEALLKERTALEKELATLEDEIVQCS